MHQFPQGTEHVSFVGSLVNNVLTASYTDTDAAGAPPVSLTFDPITTSLTGTLYGQDGTVIITYTAQGGAAGVPPVTPGVGESGPHFVRCCIARRMRAQPSHIARTTLVRRLFVSGSEFFTLSSESDCDPCSVLIRTATMSGRKRPWDLVSPAFAIAVPNAYFG
jgi:hypothetical protein